MKIRFGICTVAAFLAYSSSIMAAEAEFGITAEFLNVCGDFTSPDHAADNFLAAAWSEEGKDVRDALGPDDFLKKVKNVRAFSAELDNGGKWFAATAEGRMGKSKVAYCSVTSIDENPDGYRQDFELATGLESIDSVSHEFEERRIYQSGENDIYVMREVRATGNGYFTYVKLAPFSAKGK